MYVVTLRGIELAKESLVESYVRGVPSRTIMVRNVPHAMDEKDLRSIFGYVLPTDMALEYVLITNRPVQYKGFELMRFFV